MSATIEIRQWLAKKNHWPRIAKVEVVAKTQKAVQVKGHGDVAQTVRCMICCRELTHAVSQQVGIGPICCEKFGFAWSADESPEAVAAFRETLKAETEFEGWLPTSQITVLDGSLDAPAHVRDEKPKPEGVGSLEHAEGRMATIELTPWIAEQKGFTKSTTRVRVKIKRATEKAILALVRYTYRPLTQDDRNFMEQTNSTPADFDQVWTDDEVRTEWPKRKSSEMWIPVSQITNIEIDEPRKAPVRRRPRKIKVEPEAPREKTEYEAWSDSMLPF